MKYVVTEDQYNFLKWGFEVREKYKETFAMEVQDLIDSELENLLKIINEDDHIDVVDLLVSNEIKPGIGNRAYDFKVYVVVNPDKTEKYYTTYPIGEHIRDMIREKFGLKTSVKTELIRSH